MTKYEELLAQAAQVQAQPTVSPFSLSDTKKLEVTAAGVEKKRALGGSGFTEGVAQRLATTQKTGYGTAQLSQEEQDYTTLPLDALVAKYGPNAAQKFLDVSNQRDQVDRNAASYRDTLTSTSDIATKVGSSFASNIGNISAWGAGLVSDKVDTGIASGVDHFNKLVEETLSPQVRAAKAYNDSVKQLAQSDNALKAEQEAATYANPEARQQVRDFVDGFAITGANPIALSDSLAQAGGSLLAVPPIAKGLSAIGRVALSKATQGRLAITAATNPTAYNGAVSMLANASTKASTPLSIGLMEGAGAYAETVNEIMSMPEKDLLNVSPEYVKLREANLTHEEAKVQLASSAGNKAGLIQAPVGVLTGTLVNKFESNPLKFVAPRKALGNISREATEESLQGISGEAAKNYAVNTEVNPSQALLENVGWAGGESGIAGLGIAGVTSTPSLVNSAVKETGKLAIDGTLAALSSIVDIADKRISDKEEKTSPISVTNISKKVDELGKSIDVIVPAMEEAKATLTPELSAKLDRVIQTVQTVTSFDPADYTDFSSTIQGRLAPAKTKVEELSLLRSIVEDNKASDEDRNAAGVKLMEEMDGFNDFISSSSDVLDSLPADHPVSKFVKHIEQVAFGLSSTPAFTKTLNAVSFRLAQRQQGTGVVAALADPTSKAGQQAIKDTLAMVRLDATQANPEAVNTILAHSTNGTITLPQGAEAHLKMASAILQSFQGSNKDTLASVKMEEVTGEAVENNSGTSRGNSAFGYAQRIAKQMSKGDVEGAKNLLNRFSEFAQHFQNKGDAVNRASSVIGGDSKNATYDSLKPDGTWLPDGGHFSYRNHPNSIALATRILREASAITDMYNSMAEAFPELGQKTLNPFKADKYYLDDAGQVSEAATKKSLGREYYEMQTGKKAEPTNKVEAVPEAKTESVAEKVSNWTPEEQKAEKERIAAIAPDKRTSEQIAILKAIRDAAPTETMDAVYGNDKLEEAKRVADRKVYLRDQIEKYSAFRSLYYALRSRDKKGMFTVEQHKNYLERRPEFNFLRSKKPSHPMDVALADGDFKAWGIDAQNLDEGLRAIADKLLAGDYLTDEAKTELQGFEEELAFLERASDEQLNELIALYEAESKQTAKQQRDAKSARKTRRDASRKSTTTTEVNESEQGTAEPVAQPVTAAPVEKTAPTADANSESVSRVLNLVMEIASLYKAMRALRDIPKDKRSVEQSKELKSLTDLLSVNNKNLLNTISSSEFTFKDSASELEFLSNLPSPALLAMPNGYERLVELRRADKKTPFTVAIHGIMKVLHLGGNILGNGMVSTEKADRQNKLISSTESPREQLDIQFETMYPEYFAGENSDTDTLERQKANAYKDYVVNRVSLIKKLIGKNVRSILVDAKGKPTELAVQLMQMNDKAIAKQYKKAPALYAKYRILSLLTDSGKSIPKMNDHLVELAALAYVHWEMDAKANKISGSVDDVKLAKIFGIKAEHAYMAHKYVPVVQQAHTKYEIDGDLAKYIMKFWSLDPNPNAPEAHHMGIVGALGLEMIEALGKEDGPGSVGTFTASIHERIINEKGDTVKVDSDVRFYVLPELPKDVEDGFALVGNAVYEAAFDDAGTNYYVGENAIPESSGIVLRSPNQRLTPQQKESIKTNNNVKFFFDNVAYNLMSAIGQEGMYMLRGISYNNALMESVINVNHAKTIDGQRVAVHDGYFAMAKMREKAERIAAELGVDVSEIPVRFNHEIISTGRAQMIGSQNPQGNKFLRHILLSTRDTIDLTNPDQEQLFKLAIAQMVGIKVNNYDYTSINEQLATKMNSIAFKRAISTLTAWMNEGEGRQLNEAELADLKDAVNPINIPNAPYGGDAVLYGILEYTRMLNATGDQRKAFTTSAYLEADGVTNGPAGLMYMLGMVMASNAGNITTILPGWLTRMRRVGVFFSSEDVSDNPRTLNEERKNNPTDHYQAVGKAINAYASDTVAKLLKPKPEDDATNNPATRLARINKTYNLLRVLTNGQVNLTANADGTVTGEVSRNITKNPTTTAGYGSGASSTIDNLTKDLSSYFYAKLTEANIRKLDRDVDSVVALAASLFGSESKEDIAKTHQFIKDLNDISGDSISLSDDLAKITLKSQEFYNIKNAVLGTFGYPLRDAINEITGSTAVANSGLIISTTSLITSAMSMEFNKLVEQAYEENKKQEGYQIADGISIKQLRQIEKTILERYPYMKTEYQSFDPSGQQVNNDQTVAIGSTLDEGVRVNPTVRKMTSSGVAGMPYLIIGLGDALMMQFVAADPNGPKQDTAIFDGAHMKVSDIRKNSVIYNKAIFDAWQSNPFNVMVPSLLAALRQSNWNALLDGKAFKEVSDISELVEQVLTKAAVSDAITTVLRQYQVSIDQMAGGQSPYLHNPKGFLLDPTNKDDLDGFKNLLDKELKGRLENVRTTVNNLRKNSPTFVPNPNKITDSTVADYLMHYNTSEPTIQKLIIALTKAAGTTPIVFLEEERTSRNTNAHYDPAIDSIIVAKSKEASRNELVLHESVHAATFKIVKAYFDDKVGNSNLAKYINNLVTLQNRFLEETKDLSGKKLSEKDIAAITHARNAILGASTEAIALNEFMAWSLANANIRKQMQSKKGIFANIARVAKEYIFKLLGVRDIVVPKNMYDDIVFNTIGLVQEGNNNVPSESNSILMHSTSSIADERLAGINDMFTSMLAKHLVNQQNPLFKAMAPSAFTAKNPKEFVDAELQADNVSSLISSVIPTATTDELYVASRIVNTLSTGAALDPSILLNFSKLYDHFINDLKVEDLYPAGVELQNVHPGDKVAANDLYNLLVGEYSSDKDSFGRSALLPIFISLALTNDTVRVAIAKKGLPDKTKLDTNTVNDLLRSYANSALDNMSESLGKSKNANNMLQAIEFMVASLAKQQEERQGFIETASTKTNSVVDGLEEKVDSGINFLAGKMSDVGNKLTASSSPTTSKVGGAIKLLGTALDSNKSQAVAEVLVSAASFTDKAKAFRELLVDVVGRTVSNKNIYDMVKSVRSKIQQHRQEYREHLPHILASKFSREITKDEWTMLFNGIGKTDIANLAASIGTDKALDLLNDPKEVNKRIASLESDLRTNNKNWPELQTKMQQLAKFMNTGRPGSMLLRNAMAISVQLGGNVTKIDSLVSLYALSSLDQVTKDKLATLVQTEKAGLNYLVSQLVSLRQMEENQTDDVAINMYKGYLPSLPSEKKHLIVANDVDAHKLIEQGYTRLGDYNSTGLRGKGYYFLNAPFRAAFSQGIMQNIHATAGGIDLRTKLTVGGTGGVIQDKNAVAALTKRIPMEKSDIEALMPVFNADGTIMAYERSLDPAMQVKQEKDTNLAKMIGVFAGRKIEEQLAMEANLALVDNLYAMYMNDYTTNRSKANNEYVDLFASTDPVHKDALKLMLPQIRELIKSKFPGGEFLVQRSMINSAIGYRTPSVGDSWTHVSNMSPKTQEVIKKSLITLFGTKAYELAVNAESIIQNVVSEAKLLIVVKSIIVPMGNMASNVLQLMAQGVPLDYIARNVPKLLNETNYYTKQRIKQIELNAELLAAGDDSVKKRKIQTQIDTINDEYRRLSIWPLIEAGEFTAISDVGIGREDIMLTEGKLNNYVENLVDKLPPGVKTFGKYAIISKDTALFQGLQKSVEYGDFFAKAISYQYMLGQGTSSADALGKVTEQFVNYDILSGRFREGGENLGLWWFTAFKIRSIKTAISMMRNNPLRTLMMGFLPIPDIGQGSPIEDNAIAKLLQDKLGYSIGWGQLFSAPGLHPVGNLLH